MDPMALAGMIFTLIVLVMIGGFILLYPLSRQLAALLHLRLERAEAPDPSGQIASLTRALESMRDEVERLSERQEFTERLLERPDPPEAQ
jgi:hypothetical protein